MKDLQDHVHELDKRQSVLEEKMNTLQANLDKTLQEFKTDAEKRDKTLLITLGGLIIGSVAIGAAVLTYMGS